MSLATFSSSSRAAIRLAKPSRGSGGSASTSGSTIVRHMDVFERVSGALARKSTQGVRATQSATTAALALERAMVPLTPPMLSTQASASSCLLYTSDAADDLLCVDLGGRRI